MLGLVKCKERHSLSEEYVAIAWDDGDEWLGELAPDGLHEVALAVLLDEHMRGGFVDEDEGLLLEGLV